MEGGGYCTDENDCGKRSHTDLGSSKKWPNTITIDGFLSDDCTQNPHFCGWSVVFIPYCDGGVFSGNMLVIILYISNSEFIFAYIYRIHPVWVGLRISYFRGIRILDTVIGAVLAAGVNNAEHVILTGCSGKCVM